MKLAALYDIHGNLPALEAVLEDVAQQAVDLIIVGGDVVSGPMPTPCLDRLLGAEVPVSFIRGNADREVVACASEDDIEVSEEGALSVRGQTCWVVEQLRPGQLELLASWPTKLNLEVEGLGDILFCHASPRNDTDLFTRLTPEAQVIPLLQGVTADVIVCGHTHMQFERRVGDKRILNAGSVGLPYGEPGAYWLLLGPGAEFRRTAYDLEEAAERIRATAYPGAEVLARENIILPPTEQEALDFFTSSR